MPKKVEVQRFVRQIIQNNWYRGGVNIETIAPDTYFCLRLKYEIIFEAHPSALEKMQSDEIIKQFFIIKVFKGMKLIPLESIEYFGFFRILVTHIIKNVTELAELAEKKKPFLTIEQTPVLRDSREKTHTELFAEGKLDGVTHELSDAFWVALLSQKFR